MDIMRSFRSSQEEKKAKENEFWRKKARDEVAAADNEAEKIKDEERHKLDWAKRLDEAHWVLQAVPKLTDKRLEKITAAAEEAAKSTTQNLAGIKIDGVKLRQIEKERKEQKAKDQLNKKKTDKSEEGAVEKKGFFDFFNGRGTNVDEEKEEERKFHNESLARKEALSKAILEKEERAKRVEFLRENSLNIKVLERSLKLLHVHRMPVHHEPVENMYATSILRGESVPDLNAERATTEKLREENLRRYEIPKPERLDNGPNRTVEEVIWEKRELQQHVVAGRYHCHKGAGILYPLRAYPSTAKVLHPSHIRFEYPEDKLLGTNENSNEHHPHVHAHRNSSDAPHIRQSRKDFHHEHRLREADRDKHRDNALIGKEIVTSSRMHSSSSASAASLPSQAQLEALKDEQKLISSQNGNLEGEDYYNIEDDDSKSFPPEMRYELLSTISSESGNDNDYSQSARKSLVKMENGSYYNAASNTTAAKRSLFFSQGSISDDKKLIRVPLERHRTARGLDLHHVKGGFQMISLRRKRNHEIYQSLMEDAMKAVGKGDLRPITR